MAIQPLSALLMFFVSRLSFCFFAIMLLTLPLVSVTASAVEMGMTLQAGRDFSRDALGMLKTDLYSQAVKTLTEDDCEADPRIA